MVEVEGSAETEFEAKSEFANAQEVLARRTLGSTKSTNQTTIHIRPEPNKRRSGGFEISGKFGTYIL